MRDPDTWRTELISEIRTISNTVELRDLWRGRGGGISSFAEEVSHVFDDYDIDAYLADRAAIDLSDDQARTLKEFRDHFSTFIASCRQPLHLVSSDEILAQPGWHQVCEAARKFIQAVDMAPRREA